LAASDEPATTEKADESEEAKPDAEPDLGHGMQFGLRAGIAAGYRMVFRYDESPLCREPDLKKSLADQQKFCGHTGPAAIDLALSFGLLDFVEPFVWGRFGLKGEAETNTSPVVILGAGARIYTMSDSAFKIFIEPAVGMELEGAAGHEWEDQYNGAYKPEYKTDMIFHLAAGPQYDFARAVGIYATGGLTTGILRSIHTSLDLQFGVQVRVP
jgi:hypothetical protein